MKYDLQSLQEEFGYVWMKNHSGNYYNCVDDDKNIIIAYHVVNGTFHNLVNIQPAFSIKDVKWKLKLYFKLKNFQ